MSIPSNMPSKMPYVTRTEGPVLQPDKNYTMEVKVGRLGSNQEATTIVVSSANKTTVKEAAEKIHKEVSKFMRKSFENDENTRNKLYDENACNKLYGEAEKKLKSYVGGSNEIYNVGVAIKKVLPVSQPAPETPVTKTKKPIPVTKTEKPISVTKTKKPTPPPLPPFSGKHSPLPGSSHRLEAPKRPAPRRPEPSSS